MKQRILVLDDEPSRHALFRMAAAGCEVVQTYCLFTFADALRESPQPGLISLDHDLCLGVNSGQSCTECGCDAAELVVALASVEIPVLIHSANGPCAQVMRRILVGAGRSGQVSRVNFNRIMEQDERGGLEMLRRAIEELLASPQWPEDLSTDDLLELLGDDPEIVCQDHAARQKKPPLPRSRAGEA